MTDMMETLGKRAKEASYALSASSGAVRGAAVRAMASALEKNAGRILQENRKDLALAKSAGMRESLQDRLALSETRIEGIARALREIAAEPDPLGLLLGGDVRPNGLEIKKVSVPLGVCGVIYEARPNVTADAAALCVKSGNAVILRGGKEAIHSNKAIAQILRDCLTESGLPQDGVQLVEDVSRASAEALMRLRTYVDVLIPRGGAGLIQAVVKNASVPVIETGAGVCHVYIDAGADMEMAAAIVENAKTSRPSVCNALETLLLHEQNAAAALSLLAPKLAKYPVLLRCDERALDILRGFGYAYCEAAAEEDWRTEYGDNTLAVRIVDSFAQAVTHIRTYSTGHSECIVTTNYETARQFTAAVDAAAVYVNASTRFTDGGEFGFGAEIGISTQKLHARGPLGLRQLTSEKYIVLGSGQIRV